MRATCQWTGIRRAASARDLGQRAGQLHAGRPTSHETKVSSSRRRAGSVSLGPLERNQMRRLIVMASSKAFESRRVLFPLLMTEVGVSRSAGHDQVVVVELLRRPARHGVPRRSTRDASPRSTRAFRARRRIHRIGAAMSPGESVAVAT